MSESLSKTQKSKAETSWAEITMDIRQECFDLRNKILKQMESANIKPKAAFTDVQIENRENDDSPEKDRLLVEYARMRIRLYTIHLLIDENEYNPNIIFGKIRSEAGNAVERLSQWVKGMGFAEEEIDRLIDTDKLFLEEWNKILEDIEKRQTDSVAA